MNIIDAIKSGKRFRRKRGFETSWCIAWNHEDRGAVLEPHDYPGPERGACLIRLEDITADDWEIETEKRELSWEEIRDAIVTHIKGVSGSQFDEIQKELGF